MRSRFASRCISIAVLAAALAPAQALGANQTVSATAANQFTPSNVTVNQGETVTWNNTGGVHNVHFDDNSFSMPPSPSSAAWSVSRTFNTIGSFRYYCQLNGGPNGTGMSGIVNVNGTGYVRPKGATPMRAALAPAYKPCPVASANRTHGAPLAHPSCNPPVQVSDWLTVGTPDANSRASSSLGSVTLNVASPADVRFISSVTDIRKKSDLTDYTGELQAVMPLNITDRYNGALQDDPATGSTTLALAIPCTATVGAGTGSACALSTTINAINPGAVVSGARAVWELGNIRVLDGGPDGVAMTPDNTLFADQAVFVP